MPMLIQANRRLTATNSKKSARSVETTRPHDSQASIMPFSVSLLSPWGFGGSRRDLGGSSKKSVSAIVEGDAIFRQRIKRLLPNGWQKGWCSYRRINLGHGYSEQEKQRTASSGHRSHNGYGSHMRFSVPLAPLASWAARTSVIQSLYPQRSVHIIWASRHTLGSASAWRGKCVGSDWFQEKQAVSFYFYQVSFCQCLAKLPL